MKRINSNWLIIIFFLGVFLLYSYKLNLVPVHFNQDELGFSMNAYSIAKTGFDENGRFFPLYFWHLGVMWATPIIVYLTSSILLFLPLSEVSVRLVAVFIGLTNIALIYFLAKRLFKSNIWASLAAIFLGLTPVHFIQSRILLDNLFIVPFVLGWLLLLTIFKEKKNPWLLFFGVLILGIGVHSYHAAKVMMPVYFLLTLVVILPDISKRKTYFLVAILAFILPLIPLVPWLSQYPDTLIDQVRYTRLYDTSLSPIQVAAKFLAPEFIGSRLQVYLSYFSPEFLFFKGDASLIHSTHKAGVFLYPFAILIPVGIYQILFKRKSNFNNLLLLGFLSAPLAGALVGEYYRISRVLVILPFAALLAILGLQFLFNLRYKVGKVTAFILLLTIPLQFGYFAYDYFTDYKARSYTWFRYNIPSALETLISLDKQKNSTVIYLANYKEYFIEKYWKFYAIKNEREDILAKTKYFNPANLTLENLTPNSLLLYRFDDLNLSNTLLLNSSPYKVANIKEPDGFVSFLIYEY